MKGKNFNSLDNLYEFVMNEWKANQIKQLRKQEMIWVTN